MASNKTQAMTDSLDQMIKNFDATNSKLKNISTLLGKTSETLSNLGTDALTKDIKALAKSTGLLNDSQIESAESLQQLEQIIGETEVQYEKIAKLSKKRDAAMAAASRNEDVKARARAEQRANNEYKTSLIGINATEEHAASLMKSIPSFRLHAKAMAENAGKYDALSKSMETMGGSIKNSVAKFATLAFATTMLQKAFVSSYEQLNRVTQRGMLGAFATINLLAPKLLVSAKEFEEIINKNRTMVNVMGGGVAGVQAFGDELFKAKDDLYYLGKHATHAAARFMESAQSFGLTSKDGAAYNKTMNGMKKQFREFSGLFGDSYEEYANLMDSQAAEENFRRRLNILSKDQIALEISELQKRTENLKLMGLSNQQIIEFNKRTEDMNNPRKSGQIATRQREGAMAKTQTAMMLSMLDPSSKEAKNLQESRATLDAYADARAQRDNVKMKDIETKDPKAFMAASAALAKIYATKNQFQTETLSTVMEQGGDLSKNIYDRGDALLESDQKGTFLIGKSAVELEKLKTEALVLTGQKATVDQNGKTILSSSMLEKSFIATTVAMEGFRSIMENPLGAAAIGLVAGFAAITGIAKLLNGGLGALTRGASIGANVLSRVFGSVFGIVSKIFKMLSIPALAAAVGIKGAYDGYNTDTEDYRERFSMDGQSSGLVEDIAVRTGGVLSDVLAAGASMFGLDPKFVDKERKKQASAVQPPQSTPSQPPSAASSHQPRSVTPSATSSQQPRSVTPSPSSSSTDPRKKLLDFIGQKESGGSYNMMYGGKETNLENMTITEIYSLQESMIREQRRSTGKSVGSSAVGKYQVLTTTLKEAVAELGLDPNTTKFNKTTQDLIGNYLLDRRGYKKVESGELSHSSFTKNLSQEWASLPKDSSGRGYHDGDVIGNKAAANSFNPLSNIISGIGNGTGSTTPITPSSPSTMNATNINNRLPNGKTINTAPVMSTQNTTAGTATTPTNVAETELKKQTAILQTIAGNTRPGSPSARESSYKMDPMAVAEVIGA